MVRGGPLVRQEGRRGQDQSLSFRLRGSVPKWALGPLHHSGKLVGGGGVRGGDCEGWGQDPRWWGVTAQVTHCWGAAGVSDRDLCENHGVH